MKPNYVFFIFLLVTNTITGNTPIENQDYFEKNPPVQLRNRKHKPKQIPATYLDDDDIEKQLVELFEEDCLISQDHPSNDQEQKLSPEEKEHLKNLIFIFRESQIAQSIYEYVQGEETVTPENLEKLLKTILESSDDEILDIISFFFSEDTDGNCPLRSAALKYSDAEITQLICC